MMWRDEQHNMCFMCMCSMLVYYCHNVVVVVVIVVIHFLNYSFLSSFFLFGEGRQQKLPSAEASKRAQCTSPGQYTPYNT